MNLSPRKLEKIQWSVCLSVCIWGGLPMFRQSCYKHQKHQWAAFSEALQNPLAIMSPSPPPESLWKQWRHWSPIDCNDSHADRQEPAGQQLHQSPTAFNDSQRNWGNDRGSLNGVDSLSAVAICQASVNTHTCKLSLARAEVDPRKLWQCKHLYSLCTHKRRLSLSRNN